jgi:hypothetical protein
MVQLCLFQIQQATACRRIRCKIKYLHENVKRSQGHFVLSLSQQLELWRQQILFQGGKWRTSN